MTLTQKTHRTLTALLLVSGTCLLSNAQAGLYSRLNGQAVYDSGFNITWIANANLPVTNTFGVSGIDSEKGHMHWDTALAWIAGMNSANHLGFSDWRLPTALNPDQSGPCLGYNCSGSELGHLYYTEGQLTAGSLMLSDPPGILGQYFTNIGAINGSGSYWTGDTLSGESNFAWLFSAYDGNQAYDSKVYNYNAWAVRSGDVENKVPEPGIMGLVSVGALAWMLAKGNQRKV